MGRISDEELRRRGISDEDLDIARIVQQAQRANGARVQQRAVIVGAVPERRATPPVDIIDRQMRKRGTYDQAALLLDQEALREDDPDRAERAREAARLAKTLSAEKPKEFDFFGGGNMSLAFEYMDAITERLQQSGVTLAKQHQAIALLWKICRHLGWQSYECDKSAAELCDLTGIDKASMAQALTLLEDVGAIRRIKKGRSKVITVTPEGAYRGNVHHHGKVVERYRLDVIEGGKSD